MAFDHERILQDLRNRLRWEIKQSPIAFELVPPEFTWAQLQRVYESILERKLTAGNFRRDLLRIYKIKKLNRLESGIGRGKGRTGSLLKFIKKKSSV
jgi:8-oxo-dGTP diphosphatase